MTTLNDINSLSNFMLFGNYRTESNHLFSLPSTSKNYPRSNLDFTITVPNSIVLRSNGIFNQTIPVERGNVKDNFDNLPRLGPLILNGSQIIVDFSNHVRQGFSSYHQVYGTENPVALAALGFTTGFNLISGGLNVENAVEEIKTAEKISDTVGKILGNLRIVRSAAQAAGGAIFIPVRALSIVALMTASKVVSTLASVLGSIGTWCFNGVSVLAAIGTGIRLNEQRLFHNELNAILKDPNFTETECAIRSLEYLKKLATISPLEKEEIRKEITTLPEFGSLNSQQITEKIEEKTNLLLLKKEAYLKRLLDADCLTQIRQKGPSEANSVIEAVQKSSNEKIILASIGMALIVVGLAVTVASFIFTGPGALIIMAALSLVISLGWLLIDGYGLAKEFNSTDPGRFDKLWIFISLLVAVISVALVFFFSAGIAPIIAATVVGVLWLGINIVCYYRLYCRNQLNGTLGAQSRL